MSFKFKIENLGYDDFFESKRKELGLEDFSVARVVSENRGSYELINQNGRFLAKITGKQILDACSREDYPAVGDWVLITELNQEQAVIQKILPRKTIIKRKRGDKDKIGDRAEIQVIGTNIDVAFIVESINRDYNLNRIERYFAITKDQGIRPVVILNKIDLISKQDIDLMVFQIKERFNDLDIILTSTLNKKGLDDLRAYLEKGKTYCFLGSSGVGKSSLINKLIGNDTIKTGDISKYSDRGKHVTTRREMYFLENGSIVIDNPGIREVGLADVSTGINDSFNEIFELGKKCKYRDCTHTNEPGCEVLKAVEQGKLDKDKYNNYLNLKKESEFYEMSDFEKREKDRSFGKFLKNAKKEFKKYKEID
jgi:ribosome biogenesis GTPase